MYFSAGSNCLFAIARINRARLKYSNPWFVTVVQQIVSSSDLIIFSAANGTELVFSCLLNAESEILYSNALYSSSACKFVYALCLFGRKPDTRVLWSCLRLSVFETNLFVDFQEDAQTGPGLSFGFARPWAPHNVWYVWISLSFVFMEFHGFTEYLRSSLFVVFHIGFPFSYLWYEQFQQTGFPSSSLSSRILARALPKCKWRNGVSLFIIFFSTVHSMMILSTANLFLEFWNLKSISGISRSAIVSRSSTTCARCRVTRPPSPSPRDTMELWRSCGFLGAEFEF